MCKDVNVPFSVNYEKTVSDRSMLYTTVLQPYSIIAFMIYQNQSIEAVLWVSFQPVKKTLALYAHKRESQMHNDQ